MVVGEIPKSNTDCISKFLHFDRACANNNQILVTEIELKCRKVCSRLRLMALEGPDYKDLFLECSGTRV